MQRERLQQLTEERRRYLAGFDHHLLVCAGLGCPGNEEIVAELNRIVNERDLADQGAEGAQPHATGPAHQHPVSKVAFVHDPVQFGNDLLVSRAAQTGADEQMMIKSSQVASPFFRQLL